MRTEIAGMESDLQHKNQASRNKRDGLKIYPRETIDKKVKERTQGCFCIYLFCRVGGRRRR
ncbi:BZ3500_MvSof-1268-A1-R1_Chr7-1g09186 [Microbotryum saponariae]|nr:BZ3500_MvSof-1268-A1-R1_Chr2-2g05172 [Microbotryum saponariae]SCZ92391.1 BZ3500_MvSof-1268-A1-R1_Chr5-2g07825 [Microbotryum saponariae]SCZ95863.1 BZ3500_MvSof-1268-A1-R1_Chr8-1g09845 [Microbotryum saponariae]SCZ98518.1 BZ3501_MvSof-1269-A2-R1_Chr7-1g08891 [Microbotryum saponariae]SDA00999.1 BZ3501_MvSof-1269-A2-R1_Chr2-2g04846 [Microbotryum saponariae]